MVWFGLVKGGGYLDVLWTLEIDIGDGPLTFILKLKSYRVGGGWCIWIIASALVLFLSYEIEIGDGPEPELDNSRLFYDF